MRKPIVLLLGGLSLAALGNVACSREKPADNANVTTIRSGEPVPPMVNVEEVRTVLLARKPAQADVINSLVITSDGGIIELKGRVDDEATRADLINRVRAIPGVRGVRDNLMVQPKRADAQRHRDQVGTTTTTGAETTPPATDMHATRADAVRHSMKKAHPAGEDVIKALIVTDDGEIITITGVVPDEETHRKLLKAARETPGVKDVRDEVKVGKKQDVRDQRKGKDVRDDVKGTTDRTTRDVKKGATDAKEKAKGAVKGTKDTVKEKSVPRAPETPPTPPPAPVP